MPAFSVLIAYMLINFFIIDLSATWLFALLLVIVYLRKGKMVKTTNRKAKMLRAVTTMNENTSTIASYLTDIKERKVYDTLHVNMAHSTDNELKGDSFT